LLRLRNIVDYLEGPIVGTGMVKTNSILTDFLFWMVNYLFRIRHLSLEVFKYVKECTQPVEFEYPSGVDPLVAQPQYM